MDKLIRDRDPDIMRSKGITFRTRTAEGIEYDTLLIAKLVEEATEFSQEPSIQEAGDVLDILKTITERRGWGWKAIEQARETKRDARGGFSEGHVLIDAQNHSTDTP